MSTIGVVVNPLAGKDVRRLVTHASPVSDATKIGIVRRVVTGALEAGACRIVLADDRRHLGRRAVAELDLPTGAAIEIVDDHLHEARPASRDDTVAATMLLAKHDVAALVVLGGDGTHRDVASAWPEAVLVAVSTGTNNVFPSPWEATAAGTAAGALAAGVVERDEVARQAKLLRVHVHRPRATPAHLDDVALVEVAHVAGSFVGSRAVWRADDLRTVVTAIANPGSTGIASVAGRIRPIDRWAPIGSVVRLGAGGRRIRVPLAPGSFATVDVADTEPIEPGATVAIDGPGVLALDGERTHVLGRDGSAEIRLDLDGPFVIDVDRALALAVERGHFDVETPSGSPSRAPSHMPSHDKD